jgi:hypothetical protein
MASSFQEVAGALFSRASYNGFMRKASKRAADNSTITKRYPAKSPSSKLALVARIRQRREAIQQRVGTLSDSAALIRDDRGR